ncbi:MAG: hypothetical protein WD960_05115 [Gemmatimonadota bacterium]
MSGRPEGVMPDALEEWCRPWEGGAAPRSDGTDRAPFVRALHAALGNPGRDRGTARALLACDALLTRECASAAEDPDPALRLRRLLADLRAMDKS